MKRRKPVPKHRNVISVGDLISMDRGRTTWRIWKTSKRYVYNSAGYSIEHEVWYHLRKYGGARTYQRKYALWEVRWNLRTRQWTHTHFIKAIRYPEGI